MKHLATIDVTQEKSGDYSVNMRFEKKILVFKVRTLKEAMHKCQELIEEQKDHVCNFECQDPDKDDIGGEHT